MGCAPRFLTILRLGASYSFDSSDKVGGPLGFAIGSDKIIRNLAMTLRQRVGLDTHPPRTGWNEGIMHMSLGARSVLRISRFGSSSLRSKVARADSR